MDMPRLGYQGRVLKTKNKDAYFGIHREVAKLMKQKNICIAFDIENHEIDFVKVEELGDEKPDLKKFNQTKLGKKLLEVDEVPLKQGSLKPLQPFKVLMSKSAADILYQKTFWAHGKINKSKSFQLDGEKGKNLDSVKKSIEDFKKVLGKGTIWCLCPNKMINRSLAATNPDDMKDLTTEEQEKCKLYISIMKNELAVLTDIPYFKESCDIAMLSKESQD